MNPAIDGWLEALERRHLTSLTFAEVRRALQALSSLYVERRERLSSGSVFDGAGKRAAFALYYGPLHFLLVREIVRALGNGLPRPTHILDLGCGTGSASAAWALECSPAPRIEGSDLSGFAVEEARFTWSRLGLSGQARRGDVSALQPAGAGAGVLAAFTVNELSETARAGLLEALLKSHASGASVLIIEPISRRTSPWWSRWAQAFEGRGGASNEWRFPVALPGKQALFARAAGLDTRVLTGRSLHLGANDTSRPLPRT